MNSAMPCTACSARCASRACPAPMWRAISSNCRRSSSSIGWKSRQVLERFARHYQTGEPMPKPLAGQAAGGAQLRPGLCHGGIPGLRPDRHGFPHPAAGQRSHAGASRHPGAHRHAGGNRPAPCRAAFHPCLRRRRLFAPAITPICGRKCWMPTASRPSRKRTIPSIPPPRTGFTSTSIPPAARRDFAAAYRAFRGRDPQVEALLEGRGLLAPARMKKLLSPSLLLAAPAFAAVPRPNRPSPTFKQLPVVLMQPYDEARQCRCGGRRRLCPGARNPTSGC